MPKRTKDKFGEHHGKFKYISANFQRSADGNKVEIRSQVEMDQGDKVEVETEINLKELMDEDMKDERREKIMKNHPDRGGTDEKLKKVLDEYGD
jgi:hypothetical protein